MLSHYIALLMLGFAMSVDSLGVGATYGLRKVKIPMISIAMISLCSGLMIFSSMQIGVFLAKIICPEYASMTGAIILIGLGTSYIVQFFRKKEEKKSQVSINACDIGEKKHAILNHLALNCSRGMYKFALGKWKIIIQILKSPTAADTDHSGCISIGEGVWLGLALSLDAFGAGMGAALLGFNPFSTAIVIALFSGLFLLMGIKIGLRFSNVQWLQNLSILPAVLLVIMGIGKLI